MLALFHVILSLSFIQLALTIFMPSIFISYSTRNRDQVMQLAEDLKNLGYDDVWYDNQIIGGQRWWEQICEHVENSDVFIFVVSPESLGSVACQAEYSYAQKLQKYVLPVAFEFVKFSSLPPDLQMIQIINYTKATENRNLILNRSLVNRPPKLPIPVNIKRPDAPVSETAALREIIEKPFLINQEQEQLYYQISKLFNSPDTQTTAIELIDKILKQHKNSLRRRLYDQFQELIDSVESHMTSDPAISKQLNISPKERKHLLNIMINPKYSTSARADAGRRINIIGDPRPGVGLWNGLPDIFWCKIPKGETTIKIPLSNGDTYRKYYTDAFYISRYLITCEQFKSFVEHIDGYFQRKWWENLAPEALEMLSLPMKPETDEMGMHPQKISFEDNYLENHPQVNICWYQAVAFCNWLSAQLKYEIRLPTDLEWEKAARDPNGGKYPWGNIYQRGFANVNELSSSFTVEDGHNYGGTTSVGIYPLGKSHCGALDMCGNVWEWMLNDYRRPTTIKLSGNQGRSIRGGSWNDSPIDAQVSARRLFQPDWRTSQVGFRIVCHCPPDSELDKGD